MLARFLLLAYAGAAQSANVDQREAAAATLERDQVFNNYIAEKVVLNHHGAKVKRDDETGTASKDSKGDGITEPEDGIYVSISHQSPWRESDDLDDPSRVYTPDEQCVLNPQADVGPYYVENALISTHDRIQEDEDGLKIVILMKVYDVNTCQGLGNALVDLWQADARGNYSGLDPDTHTVRGGPQEPRARGLFPIDENGIVYIYTIFPGHAANRTNHISFMIRTLENATEFDQLENDETLEGIQSTVVHVGEFYFDQDLIDSVEKVHPYTENQQPHTTNEDDKMLALMQGPGAPDPFVRYSIRGDETLPGDMWISIGVNASASYDPFVAATWDDEANDYSGQAVLNTASTYQTPSYLTGSVAIPTQARTGSTRYVSRPTYYQDESGDRDSMYSTLEIAASSSGPSFGASVSPNSTGGTGSGSASGSVASSGASSSPSSASGSRSGSASGSGSSSAPDSTSGSTSGHTSTLANGQNQLVSGLANALLCVFLHIT